MFTAGGNGEWESAKKNLDGLEGGLTMAFTHAGLLATEAEKMRVMPAEARRTQRYSTGVC